MTYLLPQILFGIGMVSVEPKIGIAPYQNFESKSESETLNNFFDYGVDIYFPIPKMESFELGGGAEIRRLHYLLSDKKMLACFLHSLNCPPSLILCLLGGLVFCKTPT